MNKTNIHRYHRDLLKKKDLCELKTILMKIHPNRNISDEDVQDIAFRINKITQLKYRLYEPKIRDVPS